MGNSHNRPSWNGPAKRDGAKTRISHPNQQKAQPQSPSWHGSGRAGRCENPNFTTDLTEGPDLKTEMARVRQSGTVPKTRTVQPTIPKPSYMSELARVQHYFTVTKPGFCSWADGKAQQQSPSLYGSGNARRYQTQIVQHAWYQTPNRNRVIRVRTTRLPVTEIWPTMLMIRVRTNDIGHQIPDPSAPKPCILSVDPFDASTPTNTRYPRHYRHPC